MDQAEVKKRIEQFGLRVTNVVATFPNDSGGRAIGNRQC
jgi:hypothetical protein